MPKTRLSDRHQAHNAYDAGVAEGRRLARREHGWTGHDPEFVVGQKVRKVGGRYGGPGRVVGFSEDLDNAGYRLYQVAMRVEGGYGEFAHVFPAAALRVEEEQSSAPCLSAWRGWDQTNYPWSAVKHQDDVCRAVFGPTWATEDAAELIRFINCTWLPHGTSKADAMVPSDPNAPAGGIRVELRQDATEPKGCAE